MSTLLSAIRSLIFVIVLIVTVIPWALGVLLLSIFRRGDPIYWACANWLKIAIWSARWICGVRWRIQGMDNMPTAADRRAGVILLSKHQSTWETFAYPALLSHPLAYVFKRELLYVPFFGWAMARMDMIHIDRGRRAEAWTKVLTQGKRLGAQGNWVIM
ncbi:lysophospholipid acyltransferase family protein, partial [Escherichia coli]|uniref:lysophospholipid acyltransferase family protein n=1 Tax=Escherichia coli TaxID=562 RepID=UPI00137B2E7C